MHSTLRTSIGRQNTLQRASLRTPMIRTNLWTGRARVSTATSTILPRCAGTATHRTRVSEMRASVPRASGDLLNVDQFRPEIFNFQRRVPGLPLHLSG